MILYKRGRIYFGYDGSTSETTSAQNVWQTFPYPSTSMTTWRNSGDFTLSNDGGVTITYNRDGPAWYQLDAVCNVYKGTGGNASRNIEFLWHVNGMPAGPIRGSHMNSADSQIISGVGFVYLQPGDVLKPQIRNIENGDKINLRNCTFSILEDVDWGA